MFSEYNNLVLCCAHLEWARRQSKMTKYVESLTARSNNKWSFELCLFPRLLCEPHFTITSHQRCANLRRFPPLSHKIPNRSNTMGWKTKERLGWIVVGEKKNHCKYLSTPSPQGDNMAYTTGIRIHRACVSHEEQVNAFVPTHINTFPSSYTSLHT